MAYIIAELKTLEVRSKGRTVVVTFDNVAEIVDVKATALDLGPPDDEEGYPKEISQKIGSLFWELGRLLQHAALDWLAPEDESQQ